MNDRILTPKQTIVVTTYSRASLYRLMKMGKFPKALKLGEGKIGWLEKDVLAWIADKRRI